jgi:antitoxin component YwqK of YwqJK toxin-antitoxin module/tetratricopeptide (TPR) repeat protein
MRILLIVLLTSMVATAQKIELIDSGELLDKAEVLLDSSDYAGAIQQLIRIPRPDTNFLYAQTRLAASYIDNEQYDKSLEVIEQTLTDPGTYRALMMRLKAIALDEQGRHVVAMAAFDEALRRFPFDANILFSIGISHYTNKDFAKAIDSFFKVLAINPYHAGAHLNLGNIAIEEGSKTHAMFSYGLYLGINNADNPRLVLIDKVVSNQYDDEGKLAPVSANGCARLDQIVRARLALENDFKSKFPMTWPVVRQYEIFFTQLGSIDKAAGDKWVSFYLPIYESIRDQHFEQAFTYHILSSTSNADAKKWREKNEKALEGFFKSVNEPLGVIRSSIQAPEFLGLGSTVPAFYNDNNRVDIVGRMTDGKRTGKWIFFHDSGERSADGMYSDMGTKKGVWNYYYDDGSVKSIEDYDTGEVTVYFPGGGPKRQHFFLKEDKIDGKVETYYPCGAIETQTLYKAGKQTGKGTDFYIDGTTNMTYERADDLLVGEFVRYRENGTIFFRRFYQGDELTGAYEAFHPNGKLEIKGQYMKGKAEGLWEYYYSNGVKEKQGMYTMDVPIGEWTFFDRKGQMTEKKTIGPDDKVDGVTQIFYDGKPFYTMKYDKGIKVGYTYFSPEGKTISTIGNKNGNFEATLLYPSGKPSGKGLLKEGLRSGKWIYYYPEGLKSAEYNFENDKLSGLAVDYWRTGGVKYQCEYKEGLANGYFQEFYRNGQVKREGWYINGAAEQKWLHYYPNGVIESEYFYRNDALFDRAIEYNTDGKATSVTEYDEEGNILSVEYYQSSGSKSATKEVDHRKIVTSSGHGGAVLSRRTLYCDRIGDSTMTYYPDGSTMVKASYRNGIRHGPYMYRNIAGVMQTKGNYTLGAQDGLWQHYYPTGQLSQQGIYVDGSRDSVWTGYFPSGGVSDTREFAGNHAHGLSRYFSPGGQTLVEKWYYEGNLVRYRTTDKAGVLGEWKPFTGDDQILAYHPNGQVAIDYRYKDGFIHGADRMYLPDGTLMSEINYEGGDYQGSFKVFYTNGKPFHQGTYHLDEMNGPESYYDEKGKLVIQHEYLLGMAQGKATYFPPEGKPKVFRFWADMPEE